MQGLPERSPLAVLGLTARDAEAYRSLLRRSEVPLASTAALLGVDAVEVDGLVAKLEGAGLVQVREGVITAAAPATAIAIAITAEKRRLRRMQQQLDSLHALIPALAAEHGVRRAPAGHPVTFRTVPAAEAVPLMRRLAAEAPGDVCWLRPDQWRLPASETADSWVRELLRQGRRSRVVYPARALEEAPQSVRRRAELGEDVRLLPEVPFRLAIIGESVALVSHRPDLTDDLVLVLEQPALVSALTMLFESLWERALVVPGIGGEGDTNRESARRLLLDQLARGAKDEQVARTLGLSLRTVRRRVADVMLELGAGSRFQAGVEAVRRGWL